MNAPARFPQEQEAQADTAVLRAALISMDENIQLWIKARSCNCPPTFGSLYDARAEIALAIKLTEQLEAA